MSEVKADLKQIQGMVHERNVLVTALRGAREAISNFMGEWGSVVPEQQIHDGYYDLATALENIDSCLDEAERSSSGGVHAFDNGAELRRMLEADADRIEKLDRNNWLSDDTLEDLRVAMGVEKVEREG